MTTLKNELINWSLFKANTFVEKNDNPIEINAKNLKNGFIVKSLIKSIMFAGLYAILKVLVSFATYLIF